MITPLFIDLFSLCALLFLLLFVVLLIAMEIWTRRMARLGRMWRQSKR